MALFGLGVAVRVWVSRERLRHTWVVGTDYKFIFISVSRKAVGKLLLLCFKTIIGHIMNIRKTCMLGQMVSLDKADDE